MTNNTSLNKIITAVAIILLLIVPPAVVASPYWLHVFIMTLLNIGMAVCLRLIFVAGEISLCHASFMAVGAYTSTILVMKLGLSSWLGLPLGGVIAALVALAIGWATLRAKGIYFVIITLAFGEVIRLIISNWDYIGAVNGISNIPRPDPIFGITFTGSTTDYYFVFLLTLLTIYVCNRMEQSRYGLIFRSIAGAPQITESVGINIIPFKILAFMITCFFAGAFGSFYAHYTTVVHPDMFLIGPSVMYLIYYQLGGIHSIRGAIVGGGILTLLAEFLRSMKHLEVVSFGVLLLLIVLFLPEGLISLPSKVKELVARVK